jgi:hypothetical protein
MATFEQSDSDLNLDLTAASTTLAVTAGANDYTLTLTGGDTWTSSNIPGATGFGSSTLVVTKDAFKTINVADSNTGAAVNFNNSAANTYTDNLSVILDAATAGTITFAGATSMTESNNLSVSTARNITLNSATTVSTVNGNLTLQANQQATPTAGNFIGINVNGAVVQATGTGIVSVLGIGGDSGLSSQHGVRVASGGTIRGGTTGVSTVVTGVAGGSGSINFNHGVYVFGSSSAITSSGGNVSVTGTGGGGTGTGFRGVGVDVENSAQITAGGAGMVTVTGTGGTGTGGSNIGVLVGGATITSGGGNVSVLGTGGTGGTSNDGVFVGVYSTGVMNIEGRITAGGNGTVTVIGSAGAGGSNNGVSAVNQSSTGTPSEITSSGGDVSVTGTGGGTGTSGFTTGVSLLSNSRITAGGTGTVTVTGTGGAGSGSLNRGVFLQTATITSGGGSLSVTGVEGGGLSGTAIDVRLSGAITTATSGGTATVIGNSMNFDGTAVISAQSGSSVTLRQKTNGVAINLGGADAASTLGLTDAELDRVTAGTINIGDSSSGTVTVTSGITRAAATMMNLTSGAAINFTDGLIDSAGGNVQLDTGTSSSFAKSGPDLNAGAGTLAFGNGDTLSISINGNTVDTQYQQLNVAGVVNLTGVGLVLSGSYTPMSGDSFTIVANDGTDAIVGTFNGLPEGATVKVNGEDKKITYKGGTGNDVVLSSISLIQLNDDDVKITGTLLNDSFVVKQDPQDPNRILVELAPISYSFRKAARSATIELGAGNDKLTFLDLGKDVKTSFTVVGSAFVSGIPLIGNFIQDQLLGDDTVIFAGNTLLEGANLRIEAETITVQNGVTVSTRDLDSNGASKGTSGAISFSGQTIQLNSGSKLLAQADGAFTPGAVSLDVDSYSIVRIPGVTGEPPAASIKLNSAEVKGGLIELKASASERFGLFGFKKVATATIEVTDSTVTGTTVLMNAGADTTLAPPVEIEMKDPATEVLVFKKADPAHGGLPTITRTNGNFRLDGFDLGSSITVVDSPEVTVDGKLTDNDGSYSVDKFGVSLDGKTLILASGEELVDATSNPATQPVRIIGTTILPDTEELADEIFEKAKFPFQGAAVVTLATTTATAKVLGSSVITATGGSVEIKANSDGRATPLGPALGIPAVASVAAAYAASTATAIASVEGKSKVIAFNSVEIAATTSNNATATSMSTAKNRPINLVFAGANTKSDTQAFSAAGTEITGGSVSIKAESNVDVAVAAAVFNAGQSGASLTVGINLLDVDTLAHVDGKVTTTSSGDDDALTISATASTSTTAETDSSNLGNTKNLGFTDQLKQQTNSFSKDQATATLQGAAPLFKRELNKMFPTLKSGKFNLSGAVTIVDTDQNIQAYLAPTARVTAAGDVEVVSTLSDALSVSAAGNSTSDKFAAGGAVVVANLDNDIGAYVDSGAVVTAGGSVRLNAQIEMPFPWESLVNTAAELLAFDFDSPQEVLSFLSSAYFGEGVPSSQTVLTSFVRNSSAGNTGSLSGAVEFMDFNNSARAEIRDNAQVTSTGGSVDVFARTEFNTMNLVGASSSFSYSFIDKLLLGAPLPIIGPISATNVAPKVNEIAKQAGISDKYKINGYSKPTGGIGGGVTYYAIDNSAVASIGDGAIVNAKDGVSVVSDTEERNITVTYSQGNSEKLGIFGAGSIVDLRTKSIAFVEDSAKVNAGAGSDLVIRATSDPRVYNLTGGVAFGANIGIGASVGLTNIDNVVKAFIGNETELADNPTVTFEDVALEGAPTLDFRDVAFTGNVSFHRAQIKDDLTYGEVVANNPGAITFSRVEGGPDTITRANGNWADDHFAVGQIITIEGSENNDGGFQIAAINGSVLSLIHDSSPGGISADLINETAAKGVTAKVVDSATITRRGGNWATEGFTVGQIIAIKASDPSIEGASANDGSFEIVAIKGLVATVALSKDAKITKGMKSGVVVTGSDAIKRTDGKDWVSDGFAVGQTISVNGATPEENDGVYEIEAINGSTLVLVEGGVLKNGSSNATLTSNDTITRSTGSWLDDGFLPGMQINISNAISNGGGFTILEVTDEQLTLRANPIIDDLTTTVDETSPDKSLTTKLGVSGVTVNGQDTLTRSAGSWSAEGFRPGQIFTVSGTTRNNGNFMIDSIDDTRLILTTPSNSLTDETSTKLKIDDGAVKGGGSINAADLVIEALSGEQIVSFSLAGSQSSGSKDTGKAAADNTTQGEDLTTGRAAQKAKGGESGGFGFGASGDVSINTIDSNIRAYVDGAVTITATGQTDVFAGSEGTQHVTGSPTLVFTDAGSSDTISRSAGSWIADGFRAGQTIHVADTGNNDGYFQIQSLTDKLVTLVTGDVLTSQTTAAATVKAGPAFQGESQQKLTFKRELNDFDTIERESGSWLADGFRPGQIINITGTGRNNNQFKVSAVTASTMTLSVVTIFDGVNANTGIPAAASVAVVGGPDADGDGITDEADTDALDSDKDGIPDSVDAVVTGRPDLGPDGDGDGIIDSADADLDKDGIPNSADVDVDGDGVNEGKDTDGDKIRDEADANTKYAKDTDGDGIVDAFETDRDNDGILDTVDPDVNGNKIIDIFETDTDRNGIDDRIFLGGVLKDEVIPDSSNVRIRAVDDGLPTEILAGSGSVTLRGDKKSAGLAGSYAQNTVKGGIKAFIKDATLNVTGDLNVNARTPGEVSSIAASGAKAGKLGIAGQVTINKMSRDTLAYLTSTNVASAHDVRVTATDMTSVFTVSGAVVFGATVGIGASVALNTIDNSIKAYVLNSDVNASGDLLVEANSLGEIHAITAAAAIGTAQGFQGAGSVSLNTITNETEAWIKGQKTTAGSKANLVRVLASDASNLTADAGGFAIAIALKDEENEGNTTGAGTVGVSVAWNEVTNTAKAYIDTATVIAAAGIHLDAQAKGKAGDTTNFDNTAIDTNTITLPGHKLRTGDLVMYRPTLGAPIRGLEENKHYYVIKLAGDKIQLARRKTEATDPTSVPITLDVSSAGNSHSLETVKPTIDALALAGAGAGASGGGFTGVFAGAGAGAHNEVSNTVEAYITGSDNTRPVTTTTGDVTLTATDASTINSDVIGASLAVAGSSAANTPKSGGGESSGESSTDKNPVTGGTSSPGGGGSAGAIAIGLSIALNEINNNVRAYVEDSTVTASLGKIELTANQLAAIQSTSIAAAVAVSGSTDKNAVSFAGGGAVALNIIGGKTNAYAKDSRLVSEHNVELNAENVSHIGATVVGVSGAGAGGQGSAGVGVAIGASVAKNLIGWKLDGTREPTEVLAYSQNSSIQAGGDLMFTSVADGSIHAGLGAGALGVGASRKAGVALTVAGVGADNRIATLVKSYIDEQPRSGTNSTNAIRAKSVSLSARDDSDIHVIAAAASLGVAFGNKAGVAVAVSATVALNDISNEVEAYVHDVASFSTEGGVRLSAETNAEIDAFAAAASVAVGVGGKAGVAVSGAGAAAKNVILSKTNAFIDGSTLNTAGKVDIDSTSESKINAKVISASVGVGVGGTAGVGASVGVAVARNFIGWKAADDTLDPTIKTTNNTLDKIPTGTRVKVLGGVYDGDVYEFLGDNFVVYEYTSEQGSKTVMENTRVKVGPAVYRFKGTSGSRNLSVNSQNYETNTNDWELIGESDLSGQDFGNRDLWKLVLPATINDAATIQAYIRNSTITATGEDVTLDAVAKETIEALTIAGSVAIAASSKVGVAFSGAGVGTENYIRTLVKAYVDKSNVTAEDLLMNAHDTATIKADAGAASVAGSAAGKVGVSLSIGVALAFNEISNEVAAYIANSAKVTTTGDVLIDASSHGGPAEAHNYESARAGQTELKLGDRVKVEDGHTAGGKPGRIYRYRGLPGAVDLQKADYSETLLWELADASISARTGAASIAASFGETAGVAVSGAGAFAQNVINTKTNAYIQNSTLTAPGEVKLDAVSDASISAIVGAVSAAVGAGGKAGVGVSIGAAIALNNIGSVQTDGNYTSQVLAYVDGSKIDAAKSLTLNAMGNQNIDAVVLAGSVAAAGGGVAGVGVSAAGAVAINKIGTHIAAYLTAPSLVAIKAENISLVAHDMSTISTIAGAASIAAALGGKAGVAVSVGVAVATNEVHNKVETYINKIDVMAPTRDIVLDAKTGGAINAISAAASVSIGVGGKAGVAVSGAGAAAKNVILSNTNAFIDGSKLNTAGKVDIDALSESKIDAIIVAASVAAGVGGTAGVGASVGVAVARNFIGWQPTDNTSNYTTDNYTTDNYTTDNAPNAIEKKTRVKVLGGVFDGNVYEFIGKDTLVVYEYDSEIGSVALKENIRVKVGPAVYRFKGQDGVRNLTKENYETNTNDWELIGESDLSGQDFGKRDLWKLVLTDEAATIQAYIRNSTITATGAVTLDAVSNQAIDAVTIAGSVAIAASSKVGVAFSGAGVGTENYIRTLVKAYVDRSTVSAEDLLMNAHDTATINADAGAASIAGSVGGKVGVSVSIGVALAFNEISNEVAAYIANSSNVTTTTGNVVLDASSHGGSPEAHNYESTQAAPTELKLGDRVMVAQNHTAGGKPGRIYSYRGFADFLSSDKNVADDPKTKDIDETVKLVVAPGNIVRTGGESPAFYKFVGNAAQGAAINDLSVQNYSDTSQWQLYRADLSKIDFSDTLRWKLADTSIRARTGAASIAASFGGAAGVAVSGAGAFAQNVINTKTNAYIQNSTLDATGEVKLEAVSDASISAIVGSVSAAVGVGGKAGVGVSIGAAIAFNNIGSDQTDGNYTSQVLAYVDQSKIDAVKSLTLNAMGNQNIDAIVLAGSVAAAGGGVAGVGVSAAGAVAINEIGTHIAAYIENSANLGAIKAESISLSAHDMSTISTVAGAASIAAALGGKAGVAVSVGGALASNEIHNKVETTISGSDVMTRTGNISPGDIILDAKTAAAIDAISAAASVSLAGGLVGVGVSGAGALSKNEINNQTLSHIVDSTIAIAGNLKVTAEDTAKIDGKIIAASVAAAGGAVGVGVALGLSYVENIIPATALTQAKISGGQFTVGGSVTVDASSTGTMNSDVNAVSIGFAAGAAGVAAAVAGVKASHDLSGKVEAQIVGSGNKESSAVSGVTVKAINTTKSDLDVKSASVATAIGAGAAVSLSVSSATTTLKPIVSATISTAQVSTGQFSTAKLKSANGDIAVTAVNNVTVTNAAATASVAASLGGFAIAGGGANATVTATPQVNAMVQNSDINAKNVAVSANSTDTIDADSKAAAIAISIGGIGLGAAGSISNVTLEPALKSEVAKTKVASDGTLTIKTEFSPVATAESAGLAVSTGAAVGVSRSDVTIGGSIISRLDAGNVNNKPIIVGALTIHADNKAANGKGSSAKATGASGGLLIGANGAIAYNTNTTKSTAEIADNNASSPLSSAINVKDKTDIRVDSATSQTAEAGSLAVGLLSSGNTLTEAKSDNETTARIGKNVRLTTRELDLQSISTDKNSSTTKVGSFGGLAAALSKSDTNTTSVTQAIIDNGAVLKVNGAIDADAKHTSNYNAKLSALSGGLISGAGAAILNHINSTVNVIFGNSTVVSAGRMDATATNNVQKLDDPADENDVNATSGGIFAGVGMKHDTELRLNTTTTIGDQAKLSLTAKEDHPSTFAAIQDIIIEDRVKFTAGGLATGGLLTTNITSPADNISVTVGKNAQIDAKTPIHFSANENANIAIEANAITLGAVSGTGNKAKIDLQPIKSVKIDSGAKITSTKDVALLAGMTSGIVATSDSYKINNYVDSVAISLIPLDDLEAESSLQQTNTIDVLANAFVRSGGNILMYADGKDNQPVSAQAKGINWVSGLKTLVGGLFSDTEGGVGESTGKKTSRADASVTVVGTVETGLGRYQTIVIEKIENPEPSDYKVVLSHTITPDSLAVFRDEILTVSNITMDPNYPVKSDFSQRFDYVKEQLRRTDAEPEQRAFYERELELLRKEMQSEGLHTSHPNVNDISVTGKTRNLIIPELSASSGAIRIIADTDKLKDELGTLNAPSDPSITITNKTYAYITTSKLSIPEHNGGIFINGVLRPGFATKPKILVDNKLNSTQLGENFWPGIVAQGLIDNLGGDVTLRNVSTSGGQIKIPGGIRSATQEINAGLFGIVDINLANGQSLFELGGTASSKILDFTDGAGPVLNETDALAALTKIQEQPAMQAGRITIKASHINLKSLIKSGETNYTFEFTEAMENEAAGFPNGSKDQVLTTNTNKAFTVVVNVDEKGEREIVLTSPTPSGGYVNIDGQIANTGGGEIQVASGYSNVTITGSSRFPIKLLGIDLSKRAVGRLIINDRITEGNRLTTYESNGDTVYKNFGTGSSKELNLNSVDQYMPEEGLRYGFSVVEKTHTKTTTTYNEKSSKIAKLFGADEHIVGAPIVDPAPPNNPERKLHQEGFYFYVDKTITNKNFEYRKKGPFIETGEPVESEHELIKPGFFQFDYYKWTRTVVTGTTFYNDHSIRADRAINIKFSGLNEPKLDVDWRGAVIVDGSIGTDRSVTNLKADKLVTTENGLIRGQQINLTASQFGSSSKSKIDPAETLELRTDLADNVYFDYLLDDHIKEPRTAITVYRGERVLVGSTHTLGGSAGNVYEFIGATPLKTQLSNVNYANTVQWREVPNNIAINITSTDTSESLDDSVKIFEVTGNMLLGSITTHGNTWLHSAGGILSATNGGSIQIDPNNFSVSLPALKLTADSGDIGSSAAPINILTTWQTSFSATTPGNIFLHSKKDLAVDQIEAKGNVTLVFDPGFSMIDVDFHDEIDVRGIDEQAKVWENLQLTDTGFDAKRNALISDLEVINSTQYRTYWALRNQTPNPSNYTSSVRVALSQRDVADLRPSLEREGILAQKTGDELEQYIRDAVKKIEGERTDELHRLHKVVGTLTLAFNPDYKYQATPEEKKQIDDSMHKWTEEELKNLRNSSFVANFLKITDTELVIEQPNIIGASVTIKNAYGVGTYDHGQTIQL